LTVYNILLNILAPQSEEAMTEEKDKPDETEQNLGSKLRKAFCDSGTRCSGYALVGGDGANTSPEGSRHFVDRQVCFYVSENISDRSKGTVYHKFAILTDGSIGYTRMPAGRRGDRGDQVQVKVSIDRVPDIIFKN